MAEVIWSNRALSDLENIGEFIARDSQKYAEQTVKKLYHKVEILSTSPMIGRIVPELNNPNVRELIEGNYRIIYELTSSNKIHILTVHHSARSLN